MTWCRLCLVLVLSAALYACRETRAIQQNNSQDIVAVRTSTEAKLTRRWTQHLDSLEIHPIKNAHVANKSMRLSEIDNGAVRPRIVQVFALYCPPCLEEIPEFNQLTTDGLDVFGLSLDSAEHKRLIQTLKEHQPKYPIGVITAKSLENISPDLEGLPMTLVLGPKNRVESVLFGRIRANQIRDPLKPQTP